MRFKTGLIFISFCCWFTAIAQPLRFSHLGVENGLSQSTINTIFQDSKGFMWFGSADGLNKYDGISIKIYRNENLNSSLSNYIGQKIVEDKNGDLWIGSRKGLNKYDYASDKFQLFVPNNDTAAHNMWIDVLGIDSEQNLWYCNRNDKFFMYNLITRAFKVITINDGERIFRQSYYDTSGYIWFNRTQGVSRYSIKNKTFEKIPSDSNAGNIQFTIYQFAKDDQGYLWLQGKNNLACLDTKTLQFIDIDMHFQDLSTEWNCIYYFDNSIWLGSANKGLYCYNKKTKTLKSYRNNIIENTSLATDIITTLFVDRSKNLWVASDAFGLNRTNLNPPKFNHYYKNISEGWNFSSNFTKCFYEDAFGKLWIGTHAEGINVFDRKTNKVIVIKQNAADENIIRCFVVDKYNHLLCGTSSGVKYLDTIKIQYSPVNFTQPGFANTGSSSIYAFCKTKEGTLLVGTKEGLFEAIYTNNYISSFKVIKGTSTFFIGTIYQTQDGRIWVSSADGGELNTYRYVNGELQPSQLIFNGLNIRSFYEDIKNKILYMGSEKGLIRYQLESQQYNIINGQQGMPNNHIYSMLCDALGNIWLSTNQGICCYNPTTDKCRNYDVSDGLQSNEFNSGASYISPSGEFFFGGINGFNTFNPLTISDNSYQPPVMLTRFMVNDEEIFRLGNPACFKSIQLPFSENTISFDFAALDFTKPEKNQYQYKLSGNDIDWVYSGNKHFVRYSKLNPGKYQLYVKASNNDGIWSNEILLCEITIAPPWWLTIWAITGFIITILLVIWAIFKFFVRKELEAKQHIIDKQQSLAQERSRISKDMHDDLGSGLTKISIMAELLKANKKSEKESEQIEKISKTTHDLIDNMSQIIWAMNPDNDQIENILGYLRKFTLDFFEDSETQCNLNFPEQSSSIVLSQSERRNLFLVIKESYHNILKHAHASIVNVIVHVDENKISVIIRDNGKGFNVEERMNTGNGLNNMNKRMLEIGGIYRLKSSIDNGTETTLELTIH